MSRYLVTGATGFLGSHLAQLLRREGHEVVALCRKSSKALEDLSCIIALGDVLDEASVEGAAQGCDGVFHCAGLVSRKAADADAMWKVHVDGTRRTLSGAKKAGVKRAVVASTSGTVAVSAEERTMDESDETPHGLIARWPYYRSKLFAEKYALDANQDGFEVVCVLPSLLLGPGDERGSSTDDVKRFLEQKVQAVPSGGISFVDVRDAAAAMLAAMQKGRAGQRYLVSGCNGTVKEFFGRLERLSGVKAPWLPMPKNADVAKYATRLLDKLVDRIGGTRPPDEETVDVAQHFWWVDWSKAKKELGFVPRDPNDTLHDTIEDLRARGVVWPSEKKSVA